MFRASARLCCVVLLSGVAVAQQPFVEAPPNFTGDVIFASRIRSQLLLLSSPVASHYPGAKTVLDQLLRQLPERTPKFSWEVRIAANAGNIFSSPDGTIYVDDRIARLLGSQSGLWAAALSHEIAHVIHRDWARRYLFQKSLQQSQSSQVLLGAGGFAGAWLDASSSSRELAEFCRAMELEADATSVWLMARAGFHPDFVPALHHVLQAGQFDQNVNDPNHPRWHERDLELHKSYIAAGREYDRLWLSSYGSAGDGPPVVVYLSSPETRPDSRGNATIIIPLRCQNLSGSVEVVLEWKAGNSTVEQRQFTGCTSNRTLVAFTLPGTYLHSDRTEVSVLDDAGGVLNRSLVAPKAK